MRKKGSFLIAMGLLLLAAALLLTCYNIWDASRADRAAQSALQELRTLIPSGDAASAAPAQPQGEPAPLFGEEDATETGAPEEIQEETQEEVDEEAQETQPDAPTLPPYLEHREMPTVMLNGYAYIGVLEVPSMELSLPVMEQWDYDRLNISPCRFSGNVYDGDLVICAHNYPHHFGPLKYAPLGTQIKFTDAEGTVFYYEVVSVDTVGPNDVEGMVTGDWDLTLFTCNTSGQTRCAVRCCLAAQ